MGGFTFVADKVQRAVIMEYIFTRTPLLVYDSYSPFEQEIRQHTDIGAIEEILAEAKGNLAMFSSYAPAFGGRLIFRRVQLNPLACGGAVFRYCTEGWGLLHIYFRDRGETSEVSHNSEKRAHVWASLYPDCGLPSEWNWKEVERACRSLRYLIKKKMKL